MTNAAVKKELDTYIPLLTNEQQKFGIGND